MDEILNTAFYAFRDLPSPESLRERAQARAESAGLKGTLLIASEGVNGYLAGSPGAVTDFEDFLSKELGPEPIEFKRSRSSSVPFRRLLIKVKKQILTFRTGACDPAREPGLRINPQELARWLEEKRDVVLVDCRNRFEMLYGTFEGALPLEMDSFDQFPEAYAKLEESTRGKDVVMFCTGGIRCEKASSYLRAQGNDRVYQLHGGVLRYFEETGGKGWNGSCFVFDERIALRTDGSVDPNASREIEAELLASIQSVDGEPETNS